MACSHKTNTLSLERAHTIVLDESQKVLLRYPQQLKSIDDSTVAAINSGQSLSFYNFKTGQNTRNISLENFNFDSLIETTYRIKFKEKKHFIYEQGYEMNGSNYQFINFTKADNQLYLMVSLLVEVENLVDSTEVQKMRALEETKKLGEKAQNAQIIIMDYVNFIFVYNTSLTLKRIIPIYSESDIRKKNYYAYFHKNFFVKGNFLYVPIAKNESVPNLQGKINLNPSNYCLAKIDLSDSAPIAFLVSYKDLDFNDYRLQDYFDSRSSFCNSDQAILYSNGKEVVELETNKKVLEKSKLESNEWIREVFKHSDELYIASYHLNHNGSVVIAGKTCPVDTMEASHLKIYDCTTNAWKSSVLLPIKNQLFCFANDKLVFITKDDKNYYLNYMNFHEN